MQNRIRLFFLISLAVISTSIMAQTTFTQSAAAYNLNISGAKDGGHAWADYDLDGDYDLIVNTNGRAYLLRNDGGSFTDVTNINGNLAPDFLNASLERTVLFVDFNNDGYPDVFRNDSSQARIYLQDPTTNRFGNGAGGTAPNQTFNSGNIADGFNSEGAGALDYDGDGDLDIFIDNHNFGIDIFQNDGTGNFTHVTRKADSPNPPYNVADPTTWPLGLVQDATDGDYGSATDFNNDGWVDIVARKRNQVDLFTNLGGTFGNEINIDNATNNNKGAVAFQDFDNDGDFDLFWTENGINQIHRNNGDGTWTAIGFAITGIPETYSGQIEGLACGDVDNDGDIDIYLGNGGNGNNNESKLYLNQINNGGGAMSFVDSGLTFNNRNEGSTFIDIDEDGDLDLYVNKNSTGNSSTYNELWINNLNAAAQANHLYIDIIEDRDVFGLINLETRFGVGATATILDCDGNVISGIREVNGGYGHGTMEPGVIHFGLPGGPNTPIVLEISYPRTTTGRVIVRQELTPFAHNNGNINIITILPTSGNQPPIAQDDLISVTQGSSVTFDPLADNGNGVDSDPDGHPFSIISITQPANGTAVLNGDGTITYTPNPAFSGSDPFTYTLEDSTSCTQTNQQSIGNVIMTVNKDTDNDGVPDVVDIDDDNDGITDCDESSDIVNSNFFWAFNNPSGTLNMDIVNDPKITAWALTSAGVLSVSGLGFSTPNSNLQLNNIPSANFAAAYANNEYVEVSFITGNTSTFDLMNIASAWIEPNIGDSFRSTTVYSSGAFTSWEILSDNVLHSNTSGGANFFDHQDRATLPLLANTEYKFRFYIYGQVDDSPQNWSSFDDIEFTIKACRLADTDGDGIANHFDLDSDNDGIFDVIEAGHGQSQTNGVIDGAPATFGNNGLFNSIENNDTSSATITYTIAESTDDTDTIPNYLDLDSDGDGIPDNVEAQTTLGYTSPSGTVDVNGVFTNYTSGLNPTNTDGADNPDYLDTDSDNEGANDTTEAGITLTNTDTDSDGLDDATDATADYSDPGGTIDNPLSGGVILPDADGDATTGGDLDFRDAQSDADLSLRKTVDNASPNQGDSITFTLTISNAGPSAPTSIVVVDVIPTDFTYTHPNFSTTQGTVTFNAGTREFEWNLGAFVLGVGNNITLSYTVTVDVCGEFTNQVEITNSSLADPDSTPNNGG